MRKVYPSLWKKDGDYQWPCRADVSCLRYIERPYNDCVVEDLERHLHRRQTLAFST